MNTSSDCRMACENIVVTLVYSNSAKWLWWNDYKAKQNEHFSNTEKNQYDVRSSHETFDHLYSQAKKLLDNDSYNKAHVSCIVE